jgi:hypothetical protein
MKETPGATTLNMKKIVNNAHFVGSGAKYNELMA